MRYILYKRCDQCYIIFLVQRQRCVQRMMLSLQMWMSPNLCLFVCCWTFDWLQWRRWKLKLSFKLIPTHWPTALDSSGDDTDPEYFWWNVFDEMYFDGMFIMEFSWWNTYDGKIMIPTNWPTVLNSSCADTDPLIDCRMFMLESFWWNVHYGIFMEQYL